ncbi:MAG: GDSL-type esterase/lipase family protein [Phycisphaerae bacterium]|nr:GDSL-type esterase/lipase family protein [Phycisphaerae bacterium]
MSAILRIAIICVLLIGGTIESRLVAREEARSAASQPGSTPPPDPKRFASAIRAFQEWDKKNTPSQGAVLFTGSSSIVGWSTATAFPELTVLNRGFGGSHLTDVTHYAPDVVFRYAPSVIVLYAGDNDIASGRSASAVADDFRALLRVLRAELPETPLVYLSIKPSPSRWALWPTAREANERIAEICRQDAKTRYVDVATPLLGADGTPRDELFLADRLHLSEAGYAAWNQQLRPVLAEWKK